MRILAAMSGGVDSSVAAALLKDAGHEVVGVTMKLLPRGATGFGCCGSPADVDDARRVCETIGVPHYVADMAELFESKVIRPYVEAYLGGVTPNPCVECNRSVKFGHLLALAEAWGCAKVATGHYARVEGGRLLKSVDARKDQTYFLYALTAKELAKAEFPVGALTKDEVRAKARALGLRTADKPESMETCFVPGRDVRGSDVPERGRWCARAWRYWDGRRRELTPGPAGTNRAAAGPGRAAAAYRPCGHRAASFDPWARPDGGQGRAAVPHGLRWSDDPGAARGASACGRALRGLSAR